MQIFAASHCKTSCRGSFQVSFAGLDSKVIKGMIIGAGDHLTHSNSMHHSELQFWLPPTFKLPAATSKTSSRRDPSLHALVIQHHSVPAFAGRLCQQGQNKPQNLSETSAGILLNQQQYTETGSV